jgi:hypothetical protein
VQIGADRIGFFPVHMPKSHIEELAILSRFHDNASSKWGSKLSCVFPAIIASTP